MVNKLARGTRVKRKCKECKGRFEALATKVKSGGGIFCSRTCHGKHGGRYKMDEVQKRQREVSYQKKCKYGLSEEMYLGLFSKQKDKCAICEVSFKKARAMVDHRHGSKVVRELLCHHCNTLLGMARENERILQKAIEYLKMGV